MRQPLGVLITIAEAAAILGLKSRGSIYRKVKSQELPTVETPAGSMIERDGLENVWASITRARTDSPRLQKERQPRQSKAPAARPPADSGEELSDDEVPDYNEERARNEREKRLHEHQKRLIAEMECRQKANELVYREDYDQAQKATALYLSGQIEALPRQIRQQLPHLSAGDEEVIERLVHRLLNQVADWRMDRDEVAA